MIGDDPLGAGDCGALLDQTILPILLDRTPWRLSPWTLSTYPPRRPTIAQLMNEHLHDQNLVITVHQDRAGFDYLEDRSPDAHTAAERMHATMATITAAVNDLANGL